MVPKTIPGPSGLILCLLIAASRAAAAPGADTQAAAPVTPETMFAPIPRSMQQLIGDGYTVINIAVGLSGFGYLLKQGDRYVTCAIQPDRGHSNRFVSECRAMN